MRYLNFRNSEEKRSLLAGEWELDRKTSPILTGYPQVLSDFVCVENKGKTSQEFRVDLFSKRNWPIYSGRVASCVFKLIHFRVCSL